MIKLSAFVMASSVALACTPPAPSDKEKPADGDKTAAVPQEKPVEPAKPGDLPAPDDVKAPSAGAEKTASGLASKVVTPGTGQSKPGPQDTVEVHYTGWTTDGRMFDSSVKRGRTAKFPLNRVIKG